MGSWKIWVKFFWNAEDEKQDLKKAVLNPGSMEKHLGTAIPVSIAKAKAASNMPKRELDSKALFIPSFPVSREDFSYYPKSNEDIVI